MTFVFLFSIDLSPEANAVVDVGTMVVKLGDTTITDATVLGSEWPAKNLCGSIRQKLYHIYDNAVPI